MKKKHVELHCHTHYSHDSLLNKWFYLFMFKLRNIHVVAITDHNELEGAKKFKPFLEKRGIKVILGEEVFTSKGEIIGLFIHNKIQPNLSPKETMLEIKKQGGLVYIPHPYDKKRYKTVLNEEEIATNIDLIDFIEVHNGRNIKTEFSDKQLAIGNKYGKTSLIGSDAHTFIELGRNFNIMDEFHDPNSFIKSAKKAGFQKRECLDISHTLTKIVRLIKLLKRGRFHEIYRVILKRYKREKH
ncbi:PHP domain-containing protein [Salinibacillus xinjiangensis]|uniref:PHP domain-containing protein n=1 Tax=Salinibacillus xinjiangensis TaxID=1229268 RepID=A0A6G1X2B3_9BACI|nr:PHP domain-containing protein [Salinibacillus xinjiangensis]MRG85074.1 PHP domain-containing protein [Salinibacillus xinjiangensis]